MYRTTIEIEPDLINWWKMLPYGAKKDLIGALLRELKKYEPSFVNVVMKGDFIYVHRVVADREVDVDMQVEGYKTG